MSVVVNDVRDAAGAGVVMGARELEKKYRVQARTTADIQAEWDRAMAELAAGRDITFRGRKLSNDAVLNGLVLWFLALSADDRRDRAREMVAALERHLDGEAMGPVAPAAPPKGPKAPKGPKRPG